MCVCVFSFSCCLGFYVVLICLFVCEFFFAREKEQVHLFRFQSIKPLQSCFFHFFFFFSCVLHRVPYWNWKTKDSRRKKTWFQLSVISPHPAVCFLNSCSCDCGNLGGTCVDDWERIVVPRASISQATLKSRSGSFSFVHLPSLEEVSVLCRLSFVDG